DPRLSHDLEEALRRAQAFEKTYRGKIEGGPSAELMLTAVTELEDLSEQMDRPAVYASLVHAAKTDDPRHGALLSLTREQRTAINKHLIFFDLEWVKLPDEPARAVMDSPLLAKYRHYLEQKRACRPHYLSEHEEMILDQKSLTSRAAFVPLFNESVASPNDPNQHARQNAIRDAVVEALMTAAERHHHMVQRYYRLKAGLLGLDRLYDYDRYAPLFPDSPACDWPTARRIVQESYEAFSPRAGAIVREF